MNSSPFMPKRQRGAALVTALILLVILTMLGLSAMQNTTLEEKMAGNLRSSIAAFQAAESALRGGEDWIVSQTLKPIPGKVSGSTSSGGSTSGPLPLWVLDSIDPDPGKSDPWWKEADVSWWKDYARSYDSKLALDDEEDLPAPHYVIEDMGVVKDALNMGQGQDQNGTAYYRLTAQGVGVDQNTVSLLRSVYARRF